MKCFPTVHCYVRLGKQCGFGTAGSASLVNVGCRAQKYRAESVILTEEIFKSTCVTFELISSLGSSGFALTGCSVSGAESRRN